MQNSFRHPTPFPGEQAYSQKSELPPRGCRKVWTPARTTEGGQAGACPLHLSSEPVLTQSVLLLLYES